ncbi:MAG: RluA family pseudouridine synthase, partial [Clostridiales bacterium]|nr:RluA family pseudouridine synthase [Clostridiales bacterium]
MTADELQILHEDNHIIVVVKPQNVASQPDSSGDADMLTLIKEYVRVKCGKPGNVFIGLVHRLDRPTGGIMVFARTSKAAERLSAQIREGSFDKRYYAVVMGRPREKTERLAHYLLKDEETNTTNVVPASTAGCKYAELQYTLIENEGIVSLVDVRLDTGRSHQIRVQMKTIGNPVFGDARYG